VRTFIVLLLSVLAAACGKSNASSSAGQDAGDDGASDAGVNGEGGPPSVAWFEEVSSGVSGFDVTHAPDLNLPFSGGIGVAAADIDGDGKPDLVAPSGLGPTRVFRNLGSWRFSDITEASGVDGRNVANGATLCDVDGDGKVDLFLSTDEVRTDSNVFFFKGNGDGTFTDRTAAAGFAPLSAVSSVVCTDLDGDGLLDVYVSAYAFIGETGFPGRQDSFYRNRGDGTFVDLAPTLGFDKDGLTWTVAAYDYDRDGDLDLYVGNDDFVEDDGQRPLPAPMNIYGTSAPGPTDALMRNDGPGPDGNVVFTNVTASAGAPLSLGRGTMGIVAQDVDGDGIPDYYLSNYGRKMLLRGSGGGTLTDGTAALGLEAISAQGPGPDTDPANLIISWGSALEDFDLDGVRDLVLMNGTLHGEQQAQSAWRGRASAGKLAYSPVSTDLPSMVARALVTVDLDGDGDLDLALTNWRGQTRLFENIATKPGGPGAGWIAVEPRSSASAPEGRGAVVTVEGVARTVGVGGIIDSSGPAEARFGLGSVTSVTVDVLWPSGFESKVGPMAVNRVVTVNEPPLVAVTPRVVPADGKSTATVTVRPAKADGTPLGPGATVTIDATAGTWTGPVADVGDGSYTRTLVAASSPALAVVTIGVAGTAMKLLPRVEMR
jgi:hypothetical protein